MHLIPPVYAQVSPTPYPLGNLTCGGGLGPFADFLCKLKGDPQAPVKTIAAFALLISNIIGVLTVVAGIMFIIQFLVAGIGWLTSGGDKAKLEKAQQGLINAVIGLIIVVAAYAFISLLSSILGFDLLIRNPTQFVEFFKIVPTSTPVR